VFQRRRFGYLLGGKPDVDHRIYVNLLVSPPVIAFAQLLPQYPGDLGLRLDVRGHRNQP
jgi:hypothetical protein